MLERIGKHRALTAAVLAASTCLFFVYLHLAWQFRQNSDTAIMILQAQSFLQGNYLWKGWTLSTVSYYTTDMPFYAAAVALRGFSPVVMREVPVFLYTLVVLLAVLLAGRRASGRTSRKGMFLTFLLIGLPTPLLALHVLTGPIHMAAILYILVALLLIDSPEFERLSPGRWIALASLLTLGIFGDSYVLWFLALPVCIVSLIRLTHRECPDRRVELRLLGACIVAVAIAKVLSRAIHAAGGFSLPGVPMKFAPLASLGPNVVDTVDNLLSFFNANFFGQELNRHTLITMLFLAGFAFVLMGLYHALASLRRDPVSTDRVIEILAVALLVNVASYSISTLANANNGRYVVPFCLLGSILAGRVAVEKIYAFPYSRVILAFAGVLYLGSFTKHLVFPAAMLPERKAELAEYAGIHQLKDWLIQNNLTDGYGTYWNSAIVTLESEGTVRVRPVISDRPGGLSPHRWLSEKSWYDGAPANFLVFDSSNWGDVNPKTARAAFGQPASVHVVGRHTVLVWDKDVSPLLSKD